MAASAIRLFRLDKWRLTIFCLTAKAGYPIAGQVHGLATSVTHVFVFLYMLVERALDADRSQEGQPNPNAKSQGEVITAFTFSGCLHLLEGSGSSELCMQLLWYYVQIGQHKGRLVRPRICCSLQPRVISRSEANALATPGKNEGQPLFHLLSNRVIINSVYVHADLVVVRVFLDSPAIKIVNQSDQIEAKSPEITEKQTFVPLRQRQSEQQ